MVLWLKIDRSEPEIASDASGGTSERQDYWRGRNQQLCWWRVGMWQAMTVAVTSQRDCQALLWRVEQSEVMRSSPLCYVSVTIALCNLFRHHQASKCMNIIFLCIVDADTKMGCWLLRVTAFYFEKWCPLSYTTSTIQIMRCRRHRLYRRIP